ncbi:MAG: hypothetical protein H0V17_22125 [Deltaproteobacteria bacterium]|nr:hypothetical protein [Deltaproteobacteria bacterium]
MKRTLFLLLLGSCQLVFELDPCQTSTGNDEDGDGIDDGCDNCPTVENPSQENTLEAEPDALGDACDPDPLAPGNQIVLLETFSGPSVDVRWSDAAGRWRINANGKLVHESTNPDLDPVFDLVPPGLAPPYRLVYDVEIISLPDQYSELGVVVDADDSGGLRCSLVRYPGDFAMLLVEATDGRDDSLPGLELVNDEKYTVTLDYVSTTEASCSVARPSTGFTTQDNMLAFQPFTPGGRLGFKSHLIDARISYVIAYSR